MGWWGEGITQGDEPLDMQMFIAEACGKKYANQCTAKLLNKNLGKILKVAPGLSRRSRVIFLQNLAYILMESGAVFPQKLRQRITRVCKTESAVCKNHPDRVGWLDPKSRAKCLDQFITMIRTYRDGTAVDLYEPGLIERICSTIEEKM